MNGIADWIATTTASALVQKTLWLIPLMQTIHIVFLALVFSSVVMIELRVFGFSRSGTMEQTAHRFVPWIFVGVAVLAITGTVLIIGEPQRSLPSFEFQMKMLFLAIAMGLTFLFARSVHRHAPVWESADGTAGLSSGRATVNALALAALAAWALVVIYGRWIAYTVQH
jgi:hypothetical protein